jgi:twitching motility protein PilJ
VLAQQPILTTIGQTLQIFNASNPELLEAAEQVAAIKLQAGANTREVAASAQLVMLTQRLGKNLNEFLSGEGVNPETAFLLGKDTNTFRETLDGLINGSEALRLSPPTMPRRAATCSSCRSVSKRCRRPRRRFCRTCLA